MNPYERQLQERPKVTSPDEDAFLFFVQGQQEEKKEKEIPVLFRKGCSGVWEKFCVLGREVKRS